MKKIKILFYSHTIDFAGTWRAHERVLINLNKDIFQPYVLYRPQAVNNRLDFVIDKIGKEYVIPFSASINKTDSRDGFRFVETNFNEIVKQINPDIIHFARSGYYEWPFVERICPIQIETNVFGDRDNSQFLDYSVTISNKMTERRGGADKMIYYPIPEPFDDNENLINELNLKDETLIFGRIGRKDNFHPIALNVLYKLKQNGIKFKYIIIGACESTINKINSLNLTEDCIILETTSDDYFIHKFYNTINIFLHYRSDGETFGTAIAQSLKYGKPVVSHYAGFNAQSEILGNGGFVSSNETEYMENIIKLIGNKDIYLEISKNSVIKASDFNEKKIVQEWSDTYLELYNNCKLNTNGNK